MLTEDQIRDLLLRAGNTVPVEPAATPVTAPPPRRWRTAAAALAVAATAAGIAVTGLWLAGDEESPDESLTTIRGGVPEGTVPSVFAHTRASATAMLEGLDLEVEYRDEISCDPAGRPIGTEPTTGTPYQPGDTITLLVAYQGPTTDCAVDLRDPWAFVDFATGRGPAPRFAEEVNLYVDGELTSTMPGETAEAGIWPRPSALTELATAAGQVLSNDDGYLTPTLQVQHGTPPDEVCSIPRPPLLGAREALTLTIDIPVDGVFHCPVRVSIYSTAGRIDTVVTWTERSLADPPVPQAMPDVVGMTVDDARAELTAAGYTVSLEELETCDPREGIVVEQAPGQPAFDQDIDQDPDHRGVVVTIVVEVPHSTRDCAGLRSAAESLVRFASGGPTPALADDVELYVGYRHERTLSRNDASDPAAWTVCAPETGLSCPVHVLGLLTEIGSAVEIRDDMPNLVCVDDLGGLPTRLSPEDWIVLTPKEPRSCGEGQWAVQLWIDGDQRIIAVNVMLGSP